MIPASRRALSALRSLSTASSISRSPVHLHSTRLSAQRLCRGPSQYQRPFSSSRWADQQAAAPEHNIAQDGQDGEITTFQELADRGIISPTVVDTLSKRMKIHTMTEVQRMTLNHCLDGSDVIAQAKTGTGKTLAFLMPIVQRILNEPGFRGASGRYQRAAASDTRALIISPTRELAEQIAVEARKVVSGSGIVVQTAVGGTDKRQHLRDMQRQGCHILIGTPGRVADILGDQSTGVRLDNIQTFVLDEADRLLDIGFAPAIQEIQSFMPSRSEKPRQTLMFSATVPKTVVNLVRETMRPDFKFVRTIDPDESPVHEQIPQHVVFGQGLQNQIPIILEIAKTAMDAYKKDPSNSQPFKAIVFFGSTAEVSLFYEAFAKMRDPSAQNSMFAAHPLDPCRLYQMHGKLTQAQRTKESQSFRFADSGILFSSDVSARGMDFPNVTHVIQVGLPRNSDDYIHRLGRTGRAGKSGQGWLILQHDERREIAQRMRDAGINLREASLHTAELDMTKGAQIPAHVAKMLQMVEAGVKSIPFRIKADTYRALLGVIPQQNSSRPKQSIIDMMNELAQFGWGMKSPPALSRSLIQKIGFGGCQGIVYEDDSFSRDRQSPRDRNRSSSRGSNAFDPRDPFGQGIRGGTGAFGGRSNDAGSFGGRRNSFDGNRGSFGRDSRGSSGNTREQTWDFGNSASNFDR